MRDRILGPGAAHVVAIRAQAVARVGTCLPQAAGGAVGAAAVDVTLVTVHDAIVAAGCQAGPATDVAFAVCMGLAPSRRGAHRARAATVGVTLVAVVAAVLAARLGAAACSAIRALTVGVDAAIPIFGASGAHAAAIRVRLAIVELVVGARRFAAQSLDTEAGRTIAGQVAADSGAASAAHAAAIHARLGTVLPAVVALRRATDTFLAAVVQAVSVVGAGLVVRAPFAVATAIDAGFSTVLAAIDARGSSADSGGTHSAQAVVVRSAVRERRTTAARVATAIDVRLVAAPVAVGARTDTTLTVLANTGGAVARHGAGLPGVAQGAVTRAVDVGFVAVLHAIVAGGQLAHALAVANAAAAVGTEATRVTGLAAWTRVTPAIDVGLVAIQHLVVAGRSRLGSAASLAARTGVASAGGVGRGDRDASRAVTAQAAARRGGRHGRALAPAVARIAAAAV